MPALALRLRLAAGVAALAAVSLGFATCGTKPPAPKTAADSSRDVEVMGWMRLDAGPLPVSMLSVKPAQLPSEYRSRYRLKPDRRLLYAAEEARRIVSGRSASATVALRFDGDHWRISVDGEEAGTLPEIPSYSDAERFLREWSKRLLERRRTKPSGGEVPELAALAADLESAPTAKALRALRALNALAAKRPLHPRLLAAGARGAVWLAMQTYDQLQLADPLLGHAWALQSVASAAGAEPSAEDQALLAAALGYEAAAVVLAADLPAENPVRAYVSLDASSLKTATTPRALYLYLLDVARREDAREGFAALGATSWAREVSPSSLRIAAAVADHAAMRPTAQALVASAFVEVSTPIGKARGPSASLWGPEGWPHPILEQYLASVAPSLGGAPEGQTRRFEALVDEQAAALDGPVLDRESVRSLYRAVFYSGIHETARFYFDSYGSAEDGEKYARTLANPAPGVADELKRWMMTRAALRRGTETPAAAEQELETFSLLGAIPNLRLIESIGRSLNSGTDPAKRAAARVAFRRLDTRPSGLREAADTARNTLYDLRLTESLRRALADEAPVAGAGEVVRYHYALRDSAALRGIASDRRYSAYDRVLALFYLRELKEADVAFLRATYGELMKEQPENLSPLDACVEMQEKAGDVEGALLTIQTWQERRGAQRGDLRWAHAETLRAKVLGRAGQYAEAWAVIRPAMVTGKAECLEWGAWILERQGKLDEALSVAQDAAARYKAGDDYAIVARILWHQGKDPEAAEVLNKPTIIGWGDWSGPIAEGFSEVFAKVPADRTRRAFAELTTRNVPSQYLIDVGKAVGKSGNPRLAFELIETLTGTGSYKAAIRIAASEQLEKAEGREAALAWLRKDLNPPNSFALTAFQFGRYDLLCEPLEDPGNAEKNDVLHTVRAAALIYTHEAPGTGREDLIRYFKDRPSGEDFVVYGRYLLGETDEAALFSRIKDISYVCSIGWLIGVRSAGAGRYEQASDWFEVAVETDVSTIPPHAWAWGTLSRWPGNERTLSQVAKEGSF